MNNVEKAVACFNEGYSCSQAICSTYGPDLGLDRDLGLKLGTPFSGGMGRMGETCGAVTGAFMVIGLKYGMTDVNDKESKERTVEMVITFTKQFSARNGTIVCKELLEYDLNTPEGKKAIQEKNLTKTLCPKFVQDAAEILEELL